MASPEELLTQLKQDQLFVDWQKEHYQSYLSHFFCQIGSSTELKSGWEIGFFNPDTKKITVFVLQNDSFIIKPEDDVFKKDADVVEKLEFEKVKISLEEAQKICKENLTKLFPNEQFGDGFLILQNWKDHPLWNFTLITKSLKFANLKINSENGEVSEHREVELVQKRTVFLNRQVNK